MVVKNIRILKRDSAYPYVAKLPVPGIKEVFGVNDSDLMTALATAMNSQGSIRDPNKYGIWYGKNLRLSKRCKDGLVAIVSLRNKIY